MRKNWMGTVVVVGMSMVAGAFLSQTWEQVLGQPAGFFAEAPQVVVSQPVELPKCFVDFVSLPPLQGESMPRFRAIAVVDTEVKRIAAYRWDITTGEIRLLSVRDIQPDLMFGEFNATSPLPSELRREMQLLREQR